MHHEYEHSRIRASSAAASSHDRNIIAPGQRSRSELLRAPDVVIVSGLIQRQARDDRGVADGADHAVASASASSGAPLPTALMRQFETSLGADLSGVRIHTGAASAHAAAAVAAKAYTIGNDIHFGAGHYDPGSTAGRHLLAHEVAHTVQQAGAPAHPQFKLAVSSPGDPLEHEADRAADAMLSGLPAAVSGASGVSRQVLQRQSSPGPSSAPPSRAETAKEAGPDESGPSGWAGNLAREWNGSYRETSRILDAWVTDEPSAVKTLAATSVQSMMDLGAMLVDVLKLGEGAAKGGTGWLEDLLRLSSVFPAVGRLKSIRTAASAMKYRPSGNFGKLVERNGLIPELRRLFYDNVGRWARARYWKIGDGAQGRHLHHWLFPDRWKFIPNGLRQAGFNLMEVPKELNLGLTGPLIELKEWVFRIGVLLVMAAEEWMVVIATRQAVEKHRNEGASEKHAESREDLGVALQPE